MKCLPFFEDPSIREDIMEHVSGYVFDRAIGACASSGEPMHGWRYASTTDRWIERQATTARKRSVRR